MLPILMGAAAGAAALAGYASLAPRSQLFGATFIGEGPASRRLALTFDDGPNDPHTLRLLEVLARHQVCATFFLIGRYVAQRPEIVQAIARAGHAFANHTFTHPNLAFCPPTRIRQELEQCQRALRDAAGEPAPLFRPPFGGRRPAVLRVARQMDLAPVMWTVTCYDWKPTTAERVARHAARQVRGGDILLLHDGGHRALGADRAHTVEATARILTRCRSEGFEFVTVPEMMGSSPPKASISRVAGSPQPPGGV
ncbi:MAG: polysaccharide deacetylase family protein [Terriglobales bacterium]